MHWIYRIALASAIAIMLVGLQDHFAPMSYLGNAIELIVLIVVFTAMLNPIIHRKNGNGF